MTYKPSKLGQTDLVFQYVSACKDYKSLRVAIMICATWLTHTRTRTYTQTDSVCPVVLCHNRPASSCNFTFKDQVRCVIAGSGHLGRSPSKFLADTT